MKSALNMCIVFSAVNSEDDRNRDGDGDSNNTMSRIARLTQRVTTNSNSDRDNGSYSDGYKDRDRL